MISIDALAPSAAPTSSPGAGPDFYRDLVERAFDLIVTLDADGTIRFANAAAQELGHGPGELVGRNALDLIHPDDVGRAAVDLASQSEHGAPQGTSSFRLQHRDGRWLAMDVTASEVTQDGRELLAVTCRQAEDRRATDEVVLRLLHGGTRRDLLQPVCDLFAWEVNGTRVGISWWEPDAGRQFVSTGLPAELVGADDALGAPWLAAGGLAEQLDGPTSPLDPVRRHLAHDLGLSAYWVVPVPDVGGRPPALITVWGSADRSPVDVHAYGMSVARTYVELILRWTHQVRRMQDAAHTDDLTGLPNRKAFFDRLDESSGPGALLYCDLDRFKPVNDRHGHAAGDALLRLAADRLRSVVRSSARSRDLVARLGGDEFAVLLPGASASVASRLGDRVRAAFHAPFTLGVRTVEVGISIGVGLAPELLSVDTLEAADQDLYRTSARPAEGRR